MHLYSRICAVVDSFDAMTAFRPFKTTTLGVGEAIAVMKKEAGSKYDPEIVEAWSKLVSPSGQGGFEQTAAAPIGGRSDLRAHLRKTLHCPAHMHPLGVDGQQPATSQVLSVTAHSISRSGLGLLSQTPVEPGHMIRVYIQARGWQERALEGEVVRCRTYNDRWHEIGVRFTTVNAHAA
jgi:hypothetical protein